MRVADDGQMDAAPLGLDGRPAVNPGLLEDSRTLGWETEHL